MIESSDKELLEFAAKAAGLGEVIHIAADQKKYERFGVSNPEGLGSIMEWNPLIHDDDALRLSVNCKIDIHQEIDVVNVYWLGKYPTKNCVSIPIVKNSVGKCYRLCNESSRLIAVDDRAYATRRAIVLAAAEIGRSIT